MWWRRVVNRKNHLTLKFLFWAWFAKEKQETKINKFLIITPLSIPSHMAIFIYPPWLSWSITKFNSIKVKRKVFFLLFVSEQVHCIRIFFFFLIFLPFGSLMDLWFQFFTILFHSFCICEIRFVIQTLSLTLLFWTFDNTHGHDFSN